MRVCYSQQFPMNLSWLHTFAECHSRTSSTYPETEEVVWRSTRSTYTTNIQHGIRCFSHRESQKHDGHGGRYATSEQRATEAIWEDRYWQNWGISSSVDVGYCCYSWRVLVGTLWYGGSPRAGERNPRRSGTFICSTRWTRWSRSTSRSV